MIPEYTGNVPASTGAKPLPTQVVVKKMAPTEGDRPEMTYISYPISSASKHLSVHVKAGSRYEQYGSYGSAHMLRRLALLVRPLTTNCS